MLATTGVVACGSSGSDDASEGRIAFEIELEGDTRLAIANAGGSGDLTVLPHPRGWLEGDAAWSPDGNKIAYNDFEGFSVMNADGTGVRQVVDNEGGLTISFAWSPDGRLVALVPFDGLYVVDAGKIRPRRILRCSGDCEGRPLWSPDGDTIALEALIGPVDVFGTSYLVRPDGMGLREFITSDGELSWSPDGTQIAFTREPFMYVMGGDGRGERKLGRGSGPVWSPDGTTIAFTRDGVVYAVSSDGTGEHRLGRGEYPLWSRSGRIVFTRGGVLHSIESDGEDERRLGRGDELSWSPSGSHFAVSRDYGSIWVIAVDGSGERRIWPRKGVCECSYPAWGPE